MKIILISLEASPSIFFHIMQEILHNKQYDSQYLHLPFRKDQDMKKLISQLKNFCKNSDLICLSCMTNTFNYFKEISFSLKELKIPIIVGGVHPTVRPEECLNYADYVCVGEGEEVIPELADKIKNNLPTEKIRNLWIKKKNKIIKNLMRPIVQDLNSLPVPKFNLKNLYFYHENKIKNLEKNKSIIKSYFNKYYFAISSRGCPFTCKYCLNHCLINLDKSFAKIRRRNKDHLIKELKNAKKILPNDIIMGFVDDDFCSKSTDELDNFCRTYKEEIGHPFFCASTPTSMNEQKIKILISNGLIRLEIGVQSINEEVNKNIYGRHISKSKVIEVSKMLTKYRNDTELCYDFILDNPWEKETTKIETLKFILSLKKPVNIFLFSLTLYPETNLYTRAKKEGLIQNDREIYQKNHSLLENSYINTLFILYINYSFPKFLINFLIKNKGSKILRNFLKNKTSSLLRIHNYFKGLKDSIKRKNLENTIYYLKAPIQEFKKIY